MVDSSSSGTPPPREASGAPGVQSDIAWTTVQQLHELTGDVARISEAVNTLKESVREQGNKLDSIHSRMTLATGFVIGFGVLLAALMALVGWILKDGISLLAKWIESGASP